MPTIRLVVALTLVLAMLASLLMFGAGPANAQEGPGPGTTTETADTAETATVPPPPAPPAEEPEPDPVPAPAPAPAPVPPATPDSGADAESEQAAPEPEQAAPAAAADEPAPTPLSVSISDAGTVQMTRTMTWTLAMTCHDPQGCAGATVTMEMPEDVGRAPTSMTIPTRNESLLRYTVSRSGTTVTLRFTEFAANISFAQAITMNAADHTWSVGEKTIEYTATHGGVTTTPAVARGTVTGDVDSRVYKSILTAGPFYPGKIVTYRIGFERKQGANLTGMNATYIDELPAGVEFIGFVDEDVYERNLRGTNGENLDPMSADDRERFRPYRYEDGKITTVIDDRNDLETRWTNYPSFQYRARITDAALDVESRNTITQTECTLIHTDIACAPQQHRTATAAFRATPPPPGGIIAKSTSSGYRVGAASRGLGFDLRYTNTSPDSHDVVFRGVPHADSLWDPYFVTLVEANDGTDRRHDLMFEHFDDPDFSGELAETITVAGPVRGPRPPPTTPNRPGSRTAKRNTRPSGSR